MKKTINITLNNLVFTLEEDAFETLDKYLKSIREYYKSPDEEKEILTDIESSIAEKFSEMIGAQKEVITLSNIKEIIKIMGTVEEIARENGEDGETGDRRKIEKKNEKEDDKKEETARKRLYRNPDDSIIAGVCSGLAVYFGLDPIFIRIIFIVLAFVNGIGFLIYFVMWLLMPKAKTGAQKLEMRGKPVNLAEIQEAVKKKSQMIQSESREAINKFKEDKTWYKILNFPIKVIDRIFYFIKKIIGLFFPFVCICFGIIFLIAAIFSVLGITIAFGLLVFHIGSPFIVSDLPLKELAGNPFYYLLMSSLYLISVIPVLLILMLSVTMIRRKNSFTPISSGVLIGVWMLAITGGIIVAGDIVPEMQQKISEAIKEETVSKNYEYSDFKKLYIGGNQKIKVIKGNEFSLTLSGRAADLDRLRFNTEEEQLRITQVKRDEKGICVFCFNNTVEGVIVMPRLESFVGVGGSRIEIEGFYDDLYLSLGEGSRTEIELLGQNLEASLSGVSSRLELGGKAGEIIVNMDGNARLYSDNLNANYIELNQSIFSRAELTGRATELKANLENTSRLDAFEFATKNALIKTSDSARAEVWSLYNLEAAAADHSRISYRDEPENVNRKTNDSGRVEKSGEIWLGDDDIDFYDWEAVIKDTEIKIKADASAYAPYMSSIRGIGLLPEIIGEISDDIILSWRTNQGVLVDDWNNLNRTQELITNEIDKKIYWTYMLDDPNINRQEPIYIYLEAALDKSKEILEKAEIRLEWDEDSLVRVKLDK